MKVVIHTQDRENYGTAEQPYWKFKGGSTYVIFDLTEAQVEKINTHGIPTLTALIESKHPMYEEVIAGWAILDDGQKACDEWETPYVLTWENGAWMARCNIPNEEYGYFRQEIAWKHEEYVMGMGGERINYKASFTLRNGEVLTYKEFEDRINGVNQKEVVAQ